MVLDVIHYYNPAEVPRVTPKNNGARTKGVRFPANADQKKS